MSVPIVDPDRSIARRIVSRVAVWPLVVAASVIAALGSIRLCPGSHGGESCVWPFPSVLLTHMGANSGRTRTNALAYFTDPRRVIIIGCCTAEEIYDAERDRRFQRVKDRPGPYARHERTAATNSRYVQVIACTPQSCRAR